MQCLCYFYILLHCSTPLLSLPVRALLTSRSVMQPVRTSINSLHHDCSVGRTKHSIVLLSFFKDTKFATITVPHPAPPHLPTAVWVESWEPLAVLQHRWQLHGGPVGVFAERHLSSLSLMRQKWTVHMLKLLNLQLNSWHLRAGIKMAALCDR